LKYGKQGFEDETLLKGGRVVTSQNLICLVKTINRDLRNLRAIQWLIERFAKLKII
jgi:hypothetical protein